MKPRKTSAYDEKAMREIYEEACDAGRTAFDAAVPTPMVVESSSGKQWYVSDGMCGFAWVRIRPARGPFVKFCKTNDLGYTATWDGGGYCLGMPKGRPSSSQSYARKMACARAMAEVLRRHGLVAYAEGRLD